MGETRGFDDGCRLCVSFLKGSRWLWLWQHRGANEVACCDPGWWVNRDGIERGESTAPALVLVPSHDRGFGKAGPSDKLGPGPAMQGSKLPSRSAPWQKPPNLVGDHTQWPGLL
jgi:hypothetical protein